MKKEKKQNIYSIAAKGIFFCLRASPLRSAAGPRKPQIM